MALQLAAEQRRSGNDARLFLFSEGRVHDAARECSIPVQLADVGTMNEGGRRAYRRRAGDALVKMVRETESDVVHSHVPLTHLLCSRTLLQLRVPWVATVHGSWRQFGYAPQTVARPCLRGYLMLRHALGDYLTLRRASGIVAPADYVRSELQTCGISANRVTVILNGLPPLAEPMSQTETRALFGLDKSQVVIGAMGYFAPVKGFDLLISAFAMIAKQHPSAVLLIAGGDVMGETSVRGALEEQIAKAKLANRVRLLSAQNPRAGFMSALDIFVVSSRTEGLPLALIEAMQYNLPSVITSAGGCAEAARSEQESLVFRSGNITDLAKKIERLIADNALRAKLGQAARERALSYLTIERCAEEYSRFYENCLNRVHPQG
jgi:glycosyltransferase involved in cell wall biosynthesis